MTEKQNLKNADWKSLNILNKFLKILDLGIIEDAVFLCLCKCTETKNCVTNKQLL